MEPWGRLAKTDFQNEVCPFKATLWNLRDR